jgi:hypothetical protein
MLGGSSMKSHPFAVIRKRHPGGSSFAGSGVAAPQSVQAHIIFIDPAVAGITAIATGATLIWVRRENYQANTGLQMISPS